MNVAPPARRPKSLFLRILRIAFLLYLVIVLIVLLFVTVLGDRWSIATIVLYGPRWMVALPLIVLIPIAIAVRSWGILIGLAFAGLLIAGPITGGTISFAESMAPRKRVDSDLRIVAWNANGQSINDAFRSFLEETQPDFVFCQESAFEVNQVPPGWRLYGDSGNQLLTQRPVVENGSMNFFSLGLGGFVSRYRIDLPSGEMTLVNVHLPTVRPGLQDAIRRRFRDLTELRSTIELRRDATQLIQKWIGTPDRILLAGDFNMPVESTLYHEHWAGYRDAFSEAGFGWGTTKRTSWFGIRIDHILTSPNGRCRSVRVGPAMGSDHCPVIADLDWEGN